MDSARNLNNFIKTCYGPCANAGHNQQRQATIIDYDLDQSANSGLLLCCPVGWFLTAGSVLACV